jgi:hypothetical protein
MMDFILDQSNPSPSGEWDQPEERAFSGHMDSVADKTIHIS